MKCQIICSVLFGVSIFNVQLHAQTESQTCRDNAAVIVQQIQTSGDYPAMTARETNIARQAAIAACDQTFAKLETQLEAAKNTPKSEEGIDPETDPIGWLKEQWSKEPVSKKGLERLKRRGH